MDHNQTEILNSPSSLTSISSRASIEIYQSLKKVITEVEESETDLRELVDAAKKIIKEKFSPDPQSTYTYEKGPETISVKLDAVMRAMLAHAEECGGQRGTRYVASAIVACSLLGDAQDVVRALAALGTTWLTHLLFAFKTTSHVGSGVDQRKAFREDVMIRDGYTCVLTGFQDSSHPARDRSIIGLNLRPTHILRRLINKFDQDPTSDSFKSAVTTFDIFVNLTRLPVQTIEELHTHLDGASNGMMLEVDARDAFDEFYWCLKKTQINDMYSLKVFREVGILKAPEDNLIAIRDRSNDFGMDTSYKRNVPIPLPNPHYIAIHGAIAEILHLSGAGIFLDELMEKYKHDMVRPVRSWLELEEMMLKVELRESIVYSLRSLQTS